jgi:hypothetical protein
MPYEVDLVSAAQLMEQANKMTPAQLAERVTFALHMYGAPASINEAAVYEAAIRFVASVTGERLQVLP